MIKFLKTIKNSLVGVTYKEGNDTNYLSGQLIEVGEDYIILEKYTGAKVLIKLSNVLKVKQK